MIVPDQLDASSMQELRSIPRAELPAVLADAIAAIDFSGAERTGAAIAQVAPASRAPNFIGIGVQKAATTWVYEFLQKHPEAWLPPLKEVNYFNNLYFKDGSAWCGDWRRQNALLRLKTVLAREQDPDPKWISLLLMLIAEKIDDSWYQRLFGYAPPSAKAGEITPEYAMLPKAAIEHLCDLSPEVRIVIMLRNPVDRAVSHLKMISARTGLNDRNLAHISREKSLLERGNYPVILDRWCEFVPAERMFVGFHDDLKEDSSKFATALCIFLGIDPSKSPSDLPGLVHARDGSIAPSIVAGLQREYEPIVVEMARRYPDPCENWLATVVSGKNRR